MKSTKILFSAIIGVLATGAANAQQSWTDWTSANIGAGTAAGSLTNVQGLASVSVAYTGGLFDAVTTGGTNFWLPTATFSGGGVGNAPPAADRLDIGIASSPGTHTITFGTALTNPKLAIYSLGRPGVTTTWTFGQAFTILSGGATSAFGGSAITSGGGNALVGTEGNGTIQFTGTINTITWTVGNAEDWTGFTVGAATLSPLSVGAPEPGTLALLSLGIVGGIMARRRQAK